MLTADLEKLRERFYELEEENKTLRSQNNQRKSYNTHTTRISPFGDKY